MISVSRNVSFGFALDSMQPPFVLLLECLPARDIARLTTAIPKFQAGKMIEFILSLRHGATSLDGPWPGAQMLAVAARIEEAALYEDFGTAWKSRWIEEGDASYVVAATTFGQFGSNFRSLTLSPPAGVTLYPGSGVFCKFSPSRPKEVAWLMRGKGVQKAHDGRVGCISIGERRGLEMARVYFSNGNIYWEVSEMDPIPLLPRGMYEDDRWYQLQLCLDWDTKSSDVMIDCLSNPSGKREGAPQRVEHKQLGFHCAGCDCLSWIAAGSVVFGTSLLSGSEAYLSGICIKGY